MDAKDTSNPAFPITAGNQVYNIGMTLRDWFAGQAPDVPDWWQEPDTGTTTLERIAAWRYAYADAMLAERGK